MSAEAIQAIRNRRSLPERLSDLATYSDRVIRYTADLSEADFLRDSDLIAATERCLSVIGDVVDTLNDAERQLCPGTALAPFDGLGDYLIHGHRTVDFKKVWSLASDKVQPLKTVVEQTMREHFPDVPRS